MGDVVAIPDPMHRAWRVFEPALRALLVESGSDSSEIEHVLAPVRPIYLHAAAQRWEPEEGDGPEAGLASLNDWVQATQLTLLVEIAKCQRDLYRLRRE
jgi:hypothetical protein